MQTFLEFVNQKKIKDTQETEFFESFNEKDIDKANKLMFDIFKKKIPGKLAYWVKPFDIKSESKKMLSYRFCLFDEGKKSSIKCIWAINYLKTGKSNTPYSIDFFANENLNNLLWSNDGITKSTLTIYTMGSSIAYFIPVICKVVSSKNYTISDRELRKQANSIFGAKVAESVLYIGAAEYKIYENMSSNIIEDTFRINNGIALEARIKSDDPRLNDLKSKTKAQLDLAYINRKKGQEELDAYKKLDAEYKEINAVIRGGGKLEDLSFAIDKNIVVEDDSDNTKNEKEMTKKLEDPETAFKKMQIYVKSVINGMQPGVILCGAPGIGKTYRVKRQLKAAGYREGHNLYTIKGNESPRQLYIDMYNNKDKGKIIVIDDADSLVGPKAPEVVINILKAALDSTSDDEGRLVTYKVTGDLKDEEGIVIPKSMHFNASVIIITNYAIGQLDTALRGRVFTQSLEFTTEQVLGIIKGLLPGIDPVHLSADAKIKAYEHLTKLAKDGSNMEISIRTFTSCARLYQLCEGEDITEEQVNEMIEEQMNNQALRGGKHY